MMDWWMVLNVVSNISKDKTVTQTFLLLFGYSLKMIILDQNSIGIIVIYTREGILVLDGCQTFPKTEHSL